MVYKDVYSLRRPDEDQVETILSIRVTAETEDLPDDGPCSVGVHPRDISDTVDDDIFSARDLAHDDAVIAIGACGLDRSVRVSWADQLSSFEDQISISELLCKPLIIHCERGHPDVLSLFRALNPIQPWLMHGFDKGGDVLARIVDEGVYVSFGASIMKDKSMAVEALKAVAEDKFLLETGDQDEHDIKAIYARAADLRGVSVEDMSNTLQQTFDSVFRQ